MYFTHKINSFFAINFYPTAILRLILCSQCCCLLQILQGPNLSVVLFWTSGAESQCYTPDETQSGSRVRSTTEYLGQRMSISKEKLSASPYRHSTRSLYTVTKHNHYIRSRHSYPVTLYGHSIRALYTVTLYGHSLLSLHWVTPFQGRHLYGHSVQSLHWVLLFLYGHSIGPSIRSLYIFSTFAAANPIHPACMPGGGGGKNSRDFFRYPPPPSGGIP